VYGGNETCGGGAGKGTTQVEAWAGGAAWPGHVGEGWLARGLMQGGAHEHGWALGTAVRA